jgi:hypothetical protein
VSLPDVCPEPVLVNRRFFCKKVKESHLIKARGPVLVVEVFIEDFELSPDLLDAVVSDDDVPAETRPFLSAFPMFVPSLSW